MLWRLVDLRRVDDGLPRLCGFWLYFAYKQGIVQFVWFLDPVFLINWVISSIYSGGGYDHFKLKKKLAKFEQI